MFLVFDMKNVLGLLFSQRLPSLSDNVKQTCLQTECEVSPVHDGYPDISVAPLNTPTNRLVLLEATLAKILFAGEPAPKSNILLLSLDINEETQNQLQIDIALGNLNEGSVKN